LQHLPFKTMHFRDSLFWCWDYTRLPIERRIGPGVSWATKHTLSGYQIRTRHCWYLLLWPHIRQDVFNSRDKAGFVYHYLATLVSCLMLSTLDGFSTHSFRFFEIVWRYLSYRLLTLPYFMDRYQECLHFCHDGFVHSLQPFRLHVVIKRFQTLTFFFWTRRSSLLY
jgi:hypothetical protein